MKQKAKTQVSFVTDSGSNVKEPFLSIITVCLNNLQGLKKTKASIEQLEGNYEWIIIDGESNDGTVEMLERINQPNIRWISERDSGLYDAMNKGISYSSGTYVVFINSGDEIANGMTVAL